jgi:hypothetical protein
MATSRGSRLLDGKYPSSDLRYLEVLGLTSRALSVVELSPDGTAYFSPPIERIGDPEV